MFVLTGKRKEKKLLRAAGPPRARRRGGFSMELGAAPGASGSGSSRLAGGGSSGALAAQLLERPRAAAAALDGAAVEPRGALAPFAVLVSFDAAGAPALKKRQLKFKSDVLVADVQRLLCERLGTEHLALVVEKCFMPLPDQDLGSLFKTFGRNGALHISYGIQPVFG
jgi:hypothetical protein